MQRHEQRAERDRRDDSLAPIALQEVLDPGGHGAGDEDRQQRHGDEKVAQPDVHGEQRRERQRRQRGQPGAERARVEGGAALAQKRRQASGQQQQERQRRLQQEADQIEVPEAAPIADLSEQKGRVAVLVVGLEKKEPVPEFGRRQPQVAEPGQQRRPLAGRRQDGRPDVVHRGQVVEAADGEAIARPHDQERGGPGDGQLSGQRAPRQSRRDRADRRDVARCPAAFRPAPGREPRHP